VRQLGEILLFQAEGPVRAPLEGVHRSGSRLVKGIFRWYSRKLRKEAVWVDGAPV